LTHPSRNALDRYLAHRQWDVLEYHIAEALPDMPPLSFYLDGLDEEFRHAPRYWLACQEGLFFEVMRELRDGQLGGRLRVVIGIRDVVFSSVLQSEHATRYRSTAHVQVLNWTGPLVRRFLEAKIERLPSDLMMKPAHHSPMTAWLGRETIRNERRGTSEDLADYLVRHTRLLPRDVVILGNELSRAVSDAKARGENLLDSQIRQAVARSASVFGHEQLAIAANQIAADLMPVQAAAHGYVDLYTGGDDHGYDTAVEGIVIETLRRIETDRFSTRVLESLDDSFRSAFDAQVDVPSVLWQNGVLGYINANGDPVFRETGETDDLHLSRTWKTYVLHPTVIDVVAVRGA
jgi:hypothetical protein